MEIKSLGWEEGWELYKHGQNALRIIGHQP